MKTLKDVPIGGVATVLRLHGEGETPSPVSYSRGFFLDFSTPICYNAKCRNITI